MHFISAVPHQAPIYTITICTGAISRCSGARIHVALIGDGASTVPFDLSSNSTLTPCTTRELFQSGAQDSFYISPFDTVDVGQVTNLLVQLAHLIQFLPSSLSRSILLVIPSSASMRKSRWTAVLLREYWSKESFQWRKIFVRRKREMIDTERWRGLVFWSITGLDRAWNTRSSCQSLIVGKVSLMDVTHRFHATPFSPLESNVYTISIKTTQISELSGQNTLDIHVSIPVSLWAWMLSILTWQMTFANGKTHQQVLSSSETHQIAFQKDHVDFFLVSLDNMGDSQVRPVLTGWPGGESIHSIIDRTLLIRLPMSKLVW